MLDAGVFFRENPQIFVLWLAANWEKRVTKGHIHKVDIGSAIDMPLTQRI